MEDPGSGIELGMWVYVRLGFAGCSLGISDCGWLNEVEEEEEEDRNKLK